MKTISNLSQLKRYFFDRATVVDGRKIFTAPVPDISEGSAYFEILKHVRPDNVGQIRKVRFVCKSEFTTVIIAGASNEIIQRSFDVNNGRGIYMDFGKASDWEFGDDGIISVSKEYKGYDNNITRIGIMSFRLLSSHEVSSYVIG